MTRLHLIRHGETAPNKEGIALGQMDVPLTDTGRYQADCLASALANEAIVAVYTSPLQRALDTASPIAAACGVSAIVDPGLIEMDVGELDGLKFSEIQETHPDLLVRWMGRDGADVRMPGGERLLDVAARSWDAVTTIAGRHPDEAKSVAIVTHNFVIVTCLARVLGLDLSQFRKIRSGVASVSVIEIVGERANVVSVNDTCHLRDAVNPAP